MAVAPIATDAAIDDASTIDYTKLATQDGTLTKLASSLDLAMFDGTLTAQAVLPAATLENQLTIGGTDGTAYLLCDANSVMPEQCPSSVGCAIDNLIITRGEAPLRPSVVSLAGLQQNNANLLSYVHSKLATVATTGSYDDLTDKPVIPPSVEFASEQEVTDTVLSEMNYLL